MSSLTDLITEELGDPEAHRGQPFWLCPFHGESTPFLTVYTRDGKERWKCFGCSQGGDAIDFLRHRGLSFGEARKRVSTLSLTGGRKPGPRRQGAKVPAKTA